MTVITMTTSEKKADNVPLVTNIEIDPSIAREKDLEAGNVENDRPSKSKFLVLGVVNHSVYSMWALVYVLLMSLLITVMMLYGEHIYRAIGNTFVEESDLKEDLPPTVQLKESRIDYDDLDQMPVNKVENFALNLQPMIGQSLSDFEGMTSEFKGDFELGLKDDSYEKIVPVSPITSAARFIHDFSANVTGIVDIDGKQCFVMPLNRSAVLPPKSLYDLLFKMSSGYYAIDPKNVMHDMRVVKPAIEDLSEYGIYIANDCKDFPTYRLEKIVSGVYKRSAPTGKKTFSVFSGQMDSFKIVNYYDINNSQ